MMILFNRSYKLLLTAILFLLAFVSAPAAERSDTLSVTISFRQSKYRLDTAYMDNGAALRRFKQAYDSLPAEKSEVHVIGYASPEGTLKFNRFLSKTRAEVIIDFLKNELFIPAEKIIADSIGVDWPGLYEAVIADPNVPQRDKVL